MLPRKSIIRWFQLMNVTMWCLTCMNVDRGFFVTSSGGGVYKYPAPSLELCIGWDTQSASHGLTSLSVFVEKNLLSNNWKIVWFDPFYKYITDNFQIECKIWFRKLKSRVVMAQSDRTRDRKLHFNLLLHKRVTSFKVKRNFFLIS